MDPTTDRHSSSPDQNKEFLTADGKPNLAAIPTFPEIFQSYKDYVRDNKTRNAKNSRIQRKRDGEQPFNPRALKAAGQSWRNNRPTYFMSSLLKRLMPPFKQMIDQLPRLTFAKFPHPSIGSKEKEDKFQQHITDCIRSWPGWPELISQIIDENNTFGYCAVVPSDKWSWRVKMYRSDEAFFSSGASQSAEEINRFFVKFDLNPPEVLPMVQDVDAAINAGWYVKNLVNKVNTGLTNRRDDKGLEENQRVQADLILENNFAESFRSSDKVLKLAMAYVVDPEGGVNRYVFDREDGTPIFFQRNYFSKMKHALALFSAEIGDRTLHGSRGAGRVLYNTHVSVDQARNLIQDALYLSGLLILKNTSRGGGSVSGTYEMPTLTVNHPFAVIDGNYELVDTEGFKVNHEAFFALDRHAVSQAEIQIGVFMPGQVLDSEGQRKTASEVNYVASIDAQIRAGVLARFADQAFSLVEMCQRLICHPDIVSYAKRIYEQVNGQFDSIITDKVLWADVQSLQIEGFNFIELPDYIDEDAFWCCMKMLADGLTEKEIIILANQPARATVEDAIASQSGVLDLLYLRYAQDPAIDVTELKRRDISSKVGSSAAARLMNVDLDPLSDAKQVRQQIQELSAMLDGNPVPVDGTDKDMMHLAVIADRILPMLKNPAIQPLTSSEIFLRNVQQHAKDHIAAAEQKGVPPEDLVEPKQLLAQISQILEQDPLDARISGKLSELAGSGAAPVTALAGGGARPSSVMPEPEQSAPNSGLQQSLVGADPTPLDTSIARAASPTRPSPPRG